MHVLKYFRTFAFKQIGGRTLASIFREAGCLEPASPSCAACLGGPADTYARMNEPFQCVSTTNRNFPGRMGHKVSARLVYMVSWTLRSGSGCWRLCLILRRSPLGTTVLFFFGSSQTSLFHAIARLQYIYIFIVSLKFFVSISLIPAVVSWVYRNGSTNFFLKKCPEIGFEERFCLLDHTISKFDV